MAWECRCSSRAGHVQIARDSTKKDSPGEALQFAPPSACPSCRSTVSPSAAVSARRRIILLDAPRRTPAQFGGFRPLFLAVEQVEGDRMLRLGKLAHVVVDLQQRLVGGVGAHRRAGVEDAVLFGVAEAANSAEVASSCRERLDRNRPAVSSVA
jgi:hypothetical protein